MNRSIDLSPVKVALILTAAFIVLGAAAWLILILPKQSTADNLQATIQATQSRLAQSRAKPTPARVAAHRQLVTQTALAQRALPNLVDMPQVVLQLSRIADEEHVTLVSVAPQAPVPYSGYEAVPITVTLLGKFFAIQGFLQQLREQVQVPASRGITATGRLYDVVDLTLQSATPTPKVTATLTVDAFYYTGLGVATPGGPTTTTGTPTSVP